MNNDQTQTTKAQTVAQQTVEMLAQAGVKHIYGITGDSLNYLTDAICSDGRIQFVHMRNEESGAFAASAEAQLTGSLACCAGSSGPGHVHLINGLYDAQRSGASVLAIASTCPSSMFGTEYFQETDPTLLFSNCNVYNQTATTPTQAQRMLQGAMQAALTRHGVGVIGIPADLSDQPAAPPTTSTLTWAPTERKHPQTDSIKQAAAILNSADNVAIYAGCGTADCTELLRSVANKLKAPVATTFKSTMLITRDMPNYVGHIGYLGMYSAIDALNSADAILLIGQNFPFAGDFPTGKKIIQVDRDGTRLGMRAQVTLGIESDAGAFLKALLPMLDTKTDQQFLLTHLDDFAAIKKKLQKPVQNPGNDGEIRPEFVIDTLNSIAADDAVFTVDTGMNVVWASHYLTPARDRRMIGSFTHGSMANAMPMSIGAYLAMPQRQIIAICGDGGLSMLMGDLLTIAQYRLPIKVLVMDNSSLAYVRWEMELAGIKPWQTNLDNPDFGTVARALGFEAQTVSRVADVQPALRKFINSNGPAFLSVKTDPNAASFTFSQKMMQSAQPGNLTSNFMAPGC